MLRRSLAPFAIVLLVAACGGAGPDGTAPVAASGSFARLQTDVFAKSCAISGCHVGSQPAAGLSLSADAAYDALVNVAASDDNARRAGLRRVAPFRPDSSLLMAKVVLAAGAHAYDYGSPMPVGGEPLTVGQVEFIRQWIAKGAPRAGDVVDASLLADRTKQVVPEFVPLAPPAAGQGLQLRVDSFSVAPNFERELFVYRLLGNASDLYVTRIQTLMRPSSHHFLLYTIEPRAGWPCYPQANMVRDIRNPDGSMNYINMIPKACHVFVGGSMLPASDYAFPPGVALRLPPNTGIDLNVHYVNRTAAPVPGAAFANLYTTDAASVQKVASTLDWSNTDIVLPPGQRTTMEKVFTVSKTTTVFMLTSHMHQLGERFVIKIYGGARDGETVYDNTDWEHPSMVTLDKPIVLAPGTGLKSVITWNNTTSRTVSFGLQSTDEMGIIFGYCY